MKKQTNWSESVKREVWKKGKINPDHSPNVLRWDVYGNIMMWSDFERTESRLGWGINFINEESETETEDIDNLQPVNLVKR